MAKQRKQVPTAIMAIAVTLMVALISIPGYLYFVRPAYQSYSEAKANFQSSQSMLNEIDAIAKNPSELQSKVNVLKAQIQAMQQTVPSKQGAPDLIASLSQMAAMHGLSFQSFEELETKKGQDFDRLRFKLLLTGSYKNFAEWLKAIDDMQRMIQVRSVELSLYARADTYTILSVELAVETFVANAVGGQENAS